VATRSGTFLSCWPLAKLWRSARMPANEPLVPTRTGEAPMLAAQRRH
jgi:hypothetical protein